MCLLLYENRTYSFNVLSEAMQFMLGIDKFKIENQRHQRQSDEQEGEEKSIPKLQFDCQKITNGKTRKGLYVKPGINVCGVCTNEDCEVAFQIVYCHLEDEEPWTIPRILEYSVCPVCKTNMGRQIKNIAYYNCEWKVIGKIKGESKSFKVVEKTDEDECKQYLQKDKEPTVEFEYLIVEAKPF